FSGAIVQGATSVAVMGLDPSTEYKYRVSTITADGASLFSNTVAVTTAAAGPPPPNNLRHELVGNEGFVVMFDAVPDATSYELELSSDNFATIMDDYTAAVPAWPNPYWNIVGLQPSTEYQ